MKALLVKLVNKTVGGSMYPAFNTLQSIVDYGEDWAYYVAKETSGWVTDKKDDRNADTLDSPRGIHLAMVIAPDAFVDESVVAFNSVCSVLSKAEATTFYESKVTYLQDSEILDKDVLESIAAKSALGKSLTSEQTDALDPTKEMRGIRTNNIKAFTGFLAKKGIVFA